MSTHFSFALNIVHKALSVIGLIGFVHSHPSFKQGKFWELNLFMKYFVIILNPFVFNFDIVMDRSDPSKIVNGIPASAGEYPYMVNAEYLFNHR